MPVIAKDYPGKHDNIAKQGYRDYLNANTTECSGVVGCGCLSCQPLPFERWYREVWLEKHGGTADIPE